MPASGLSIALFTGDPHETRPAGNRQFLIPKTTH